MEEAREFLYEHEINKIRRELQENPANFLWIWGGGREPSLPSFKDMFNCKGGIISTFPEIQGLGKSIGLKIISLPEIPEKTNMKDTRNTRNIKYNTIVNYALNAFKNLDLLCIHIGDFIEIARYEDITQKVRLLEKIDEKIIAPLYQEIANQDCIIIIVGGFFVSEQKKNGSSRPVPFALGGTNIPGGTGLNFCEKNAQKVQLMIDSGHELLPFVFRVRE